MKKATYECDLCGRRYDLESLVNWGIHKKDYSKGLDRQDFDLCPECQLKIRTLMKELRSVA